MKKLFSFFVFSTIASLLFAQKAELFLYPDHLNPKACMLRSGDTRIQITPMNQVELLFNITQLEPNDDAMLYLSEIKEHEWRISLRLPPATENLQALLANSDGPSPLEAELFLNGVTSSQEARVEQTTHPIPGTAVFIITVPYRNMGIEQDGETRIRIVLSLE